MKLSELSGKANLILKSLQKHYSLKDWPRKILGMLAISKSRHYVTSNPKNRARFSSRMPGARLPGVPTVRTSIPHRAHLHQIHRLRSWQPQSYAHQHRLSGNLTDRENFVTRFLNCVSPQKGNWSQVKDNWQTKTITCHWLKFSLLSENKVQMMAKP